MSLLDHIRRATDPDRLALSHPQTGLVLSYDQLRRTALAMAGTLVEHGAVAGDRVIAFTQNSPYFFPLLLACAELDLIVVPVSPHLLPQQYNVIVDHANPRFWVQLEPGRSIPTRHARDVQLSTETLLAGAPDRPPAAPPSLDATTLLIYTSGTTGSPKAVMLTHRNLLAAARMMSACFGIAADDVVYSGLPLHHVNPITVSGLPALAGHAHLVMGPVFGPSSLATYWDRVRDHDVTLASMTPSIVAALSRPGLAVPRRSPRLRGVLVGGSSLAPAVWRRFEERVDVPIHHGYGLTETATWITANPPRRTPNRDAVGVVLSDEIEVRVNAGEIQIRGPVVSPGYYRDRRVTGTSFTEDGFLRTGDLGFFDDGGDLHITGRIKEIIKRNAIHIDPLEIDAMIARHPAVSDCKTFGIPNPTMGEQIVTAIVWNGPPAPELEIRTWIQSRLPAELCPNVLMATRILPRGAAGKPLLGVLRGMATRELSQRIVETLGSRRYSRHEPSDSVALRDKVQAALLGEPLKLLMLWGCGPRREVGEPDDLALQRLAELRANVQVVDDVPCSVELLLTDVHARLNGHADEHITGYHAGVESLAAMYGVTCSRESSVWSQSRLAPADVLAQLEDGRFQLRWEGLAPELKDRFVKQAARHAAASDPVSAAQRYLSACLLERPHLTRRFERAVLLTYNGPEFDFCVPDLPKLYIYPHTRSSTAKPWFTSRRSA